MPRTPQIAKASDLAGSVATGRAAKLLEATPEDDPEALLALTLEHIRESRILLARQVAAEGTTRFPDHAELRNADRILSGGQATPHPGTEPNTDEEFEWLRNPPAWVRGKWVALVGRKAIAVADTLAEVMASIRAMDLPKKPLVHRIA